MIRFGAIAVLAFWLATGQQEMLAAPVDPLNWMAALDGKKLLSEFTLPGTHDSGALREPAYGTTRCQSIPIKQQLAIGVRFLDIRCVIRGGGLEIYHGIIDQQLTFDAVLNDCIEFLQTHKGETLIFSVQKEHGSDDAIRFEQIFDSYVLKNPGVWLLKDTLPTLDEARGKIVLLRRFNASKLPKGIAAIPKDWNDDTSFVIKGATEIHIQDKYALDDVAGKWPAIQPLLREAFEGKRSALFLNFTSGYVRESILNIPDIPKVASDVNSRVSVFFGEAPPGRYGVIVMDFADQRECEEVIATNSDR